MNSVKEIISRVWNYRGAILLMVIGVLIYLLVRATQASREPVIVMNPVNLDNLKKVEELRDQNGKLYAKVEQIIVDRDNTAKFADSLAKALKLKPKEIQGAERIVYKTDTVFKDKVVYFPTTGNATITHQDPWVTISATITKDSIGNIAYSSVDTLTRIESIHNPLIGATKRTVIIGNANPYNVIAEGSSFTIKEKRTWASIGPSLQYNPFTQKMAVGISLQLPIIQLKK